MKTRQKERLKRVLPYVGLAILVVASIVMIAYAMGMPGWEGSFLNYKRK